MTVTVRTSGFRELEAELAKLSKAAGKGALRRGAAKALEPMRAAAVAAAPDDPESGGVDLKRSIRVLARARVGRSIDRLSEGSAAVNLYMGPVTRMVRYAHAVVMEFGSFKDQPQPYMRPAWDAEARPTLERLKDFLWAEVRRSVARAAARAARLASRRG